MARKATRNAHGAGTIRQRSDGRWEARYTVGRDPGTGKQIQKSVYGKTQKEVRQKLQQAIVAIDEGVYMEPSRLTVGAWVDLWLEEYNSDIKPLTKSAYEAHIRNNIKPALGAVKLSALNATHVQKLYNTLHKGTDKRPPLSPKTIKNLHGVLHKALKQAVELGYIKFNPSDACKLPRVERVEIKPLDEDQISVFLQAIQGHKYEYVYLVDLFTGMREGEILGLTWDCVDFKEGSIFICKQLIKEKKKGGAFLFAPLKNDKTRRITPAPFVMRALQEQRRVQAEWQIKAGPLWENSGLVFTNELGGHLVHGTVYNNFKRIVQSIGIPEARFHDLRHSYAVAALQSGDDVKTVQEALGHHTAAFTLDVYGHVSERMKRDSAERMEGFIMGLKLG